MVIILLLAGGGFTYLGLWLKRRRHNRRHPIQYHDSTLVLEDAVASLRSRHPEMGSMTNLPALGMNGSREMIAGTPPPGAVRPGSGAWKGKYRAEAREMPPSPLDDVMNDSMLPPPRRTGSNRLVRQDSPKDGF